MLEFHTLLESHAAAGIWPVVILCNSCWNPPACKDSMTKLNPLALGVLPATPLLPRERGSWLSLPHPVQESSIWACLWRPYSSSGTSSSPQATQGASGCGMPSPSTGRSGHWPAWLPLSRVPRPVRPREGFLSAPPDLERTRGPSSGPDPVVG